MPVTDAKNFILKLFQIFCFLAGQELHEPAYEVMRLLVTTITLN